MLRQFSTRLIATTCLRRAVQIELNATQLKPPLSVNCLDFVQVRNKYVTSGVQGRRNAKTPPKKVYEEDDDELLEDGNEDEVSLRDR